MQKIRTEFPKMPWMPDTLSGSGVWWWSYTCTLIFIYIRFWDLVVELHMHTNMYAVYACGCSLSVTCQVAMVNTIMC